MKRVVAIHDVMMPLGLGLRDDEAKVQQILAVSIELLLTPSGFVDYVKALDVVRSYGSVGHPHPLVEDVAVDLANRILALSVSILEVSVTVTKTVTLESETFTISGMAIESGQS